LSDAVIYVIDEIGDRDIDIEYLDDCEAALSVAPEKTFVKA
jgi:hypothetical protein